MDQKFIILSSYKTFELKCLIGFGAVNKVLTFQYNVIKMQSLSKVSMSRKPKTISLMIHGGTFSIPFAIAFDPILTSIIKERYWSPIFDQSPVFVFLLY